MKQELLPIAVGYMPLRIPWQLASLLKMARRVPHIGTSPGGYIEDDIDITGTKGRISLSTFGNEPAQVFTSDGIEKFDLPNPVHIQTPMIQSIVDELLGRGKCPSTGETALRTARIMDAALNSYYGGRSDAFWTRPDTWPGRPKPQ